MDSRKRIVDLRSDTVTLPCKGMLSLMHNASFKDNFLEADPSTRALERRCAEMFGFEDGVFTVSGTMANQVAVKLYTNVGDEIVLDNSYHINYYESASVSTLSGVKLNLINSEDGIITQGHLNDVINNRNKSTLNSEIKLLCLENTINYHAGKIFPFGKLESISAFARKKGLAIHLDGARIFNAACAEGVDVAKYSKVADSLMISFTKGLGAPLGAVLLGRKNIVERARKYSKWFGGGMHQSGIMAECALYALNNNIELIRDDNLKAQKLAGLLDHCTDYGVKISKVETNIIMINLTDVNIRSEEFVARLKVRGVLLYHWSQYIVRAVIHKDVKEGDLEFVASEILQVISAFETNLSMVRVYGK